MAKIRRTVSAISDLDKDLRIDITVDIDVNAEGLFTTTLKGEDARLIETYGIKLDRNRVQNPGFFKSDTMAGLIGQIHDVLKQCVNYNVVSRKPVIMYYIDTICSYCLNPETGDICPNGQSKYTGVGGNFADWKEGTYKPCSFDDNYFGIKFYAEPFMKVEVEYGNGVRKTFLEGAEWGDGTYMQWLSDVPSFKTRKSYARAQEIEGTEDNARFFVNLIKSICKLNENIGEFLKEGRLDLLIQKTFQLENITNK